MSQQANVKRWKFEPNYLGQAVVADAETSFILLATHTLDPKVSLTCEILVDLHNTDYALLLDRCEAAEKSANHIAKEKGEAVLDWQHAIADRNAALERQRVLEDVVKDAAELMDAMSRDFESGVHTGARAKIALADWRNRAKRAHLDTLPPKEKL